MTVNENFIKSIEHHPLRWFTSREIAAKMNKSLGSFSPKQDQGENSIP